ncbi:ATP-grasp domain-containing protein [Deinococcus sedimenti]|uniref:ATP-grasp domain-containing protein n=1 Tax=Deinococcus sedimenti TaxID=1867090 RepID=A0ABQ2S1Q8_9DEIO|nr:hypothetical protein GCM10008960_03310 [Deinococcus sedimenti]
MFLKGGVKSSKEEGWDACVAQDDAQVQRLARDLLARPGRSRGHVVLREVVALRRITTTYDQFPLGREFRVFLFRHHVLAYGFYWEEQAPERQLDPAEETQMLRCAVQASLRLDVPYLSVDVGQLDSGAWTVIEVGDAQFTGLSQVSALTLWTRLLHQLTSPD